MEISFCAKVIIKRKGLWWKFPTIRFSFSIQGKRKWWKLSFFAVFFKVLANLQKSKLFNDIRSERFHWYLKFEKIFKLIKITKKFTADNILAVLSKEFYQQLITEHFSDFFIIRKFNIDIKFQLNFAPGIKSTQVFD